MMADRPQLRVGIVLASRQIADWFADAIRRASNTSVLSAFVVPNLPHRAMDTPVGSGILRSALALDRLRAGFRRDPNQPADLPCLVQYVPDRDEWLASVARGTYGLDLIVVGCDVADEVVAALSRAVPLGVCALVTESRNAASHLCPGVASIAHDSPTLRTDAVLYKDGECRLLGRVEMRLHRSSIAGNVDRTLNPSRGLLQTALLKLSRNRHSISASFPLWDCRGDAAKLGLATSVRGLAALASGFMRNRFTPETEGQWAIGVLHGRRTGSKAITGADIQWTDSPPDRFLADPFPVAAYGTLYVFVEEFPYSSAKGHISVMARSEDGSFSNPVKIIESEFHLSFPFVFQHDERWYMIPERSEGGSIVLYEATGFPYEWRECRVLVPDFAGIDTVLHRRGGKYWLLTSSAADGNQDNNLHLFHAASLFGEFRPHGLNPVKTTIASSRNAGRLFSRRGQLYRPSQNGTYKYGGSIVLNRVIRFDEDDYVEEQCDEISPPPDCEFPLGLHTLNYAGNWTVIDGLRHVPRRTVYSGIKAASRLSPPRQPIATYPYVSAIAHAEADRAD